MLSYNLIIDKFNIVKDEHPEKIWFKNLSLEILKLDKFSELKEVHPKNIKFIVPTLDVSIFEKFIEIKMRISKTCYPTWIL